MEPAFAIWNFLYCRVRLEVGTFTYHCYLHPNSMKGTFVVTGASATGPPGSGSSGVSTLEALGVVIVVVVAVEVAALALRQRSKGS